MDDQEAGSISTDIVPTLEEQEEEFKKQIEAEEKEAKAKEDK